MSFDIPASMERDIQQYAQAENLSPEAAVLKLIQDALKSKRRKSAGRAIPVAPSLRHSTPTTDHLRRSSQ
jgi:hypothetical protein